MGAVITKLYNVLMNHLMDSSNLLHVILHRSAAEASILNSDWSESVE